MSDSFSMSDLAPVVMKHPSEKKPPSQNGSNKPPSLEKKSSQSDSVDSMYDVFRGRVVPADSQKFLLICAKEGSATIDGQAVSFVFIDKRVIHGEVIVSGLLFCITPPALFFHFFFLLMTDSTS